MDQPGEVNNPARGQLNTENEYFSVRVRAREFSLARRDRPSRPASGCAFSILRLNLVLTHGIPPEFRGGVHLFIKTTTRHRVSPKLIGSYNCVPMASTAESHPGTWPVVFKVVPVTGAALAGHHGPINEHLSFPAPIIGMKWAY